MRISKEHEYTAVNLDEDVGPPQRKTKRRMATWKIIALVEAANILFFGLGFGGWHVKHRHPYHILNQPHKHNVTEKFTVDKSDLHLALNTGAANNYWMSLTRDRNNGLVSLPNSLTSRLLLNPSNLTTAPGESVYQVDMFHQLHCLERIRSDLISAPYLYQLNPNRTDDDPHSRHTLHCVDYLRQAIMCNGDLTLVSTDKDLEFDHSPERKCRDFEAIAEWVWSRRWDYEKWTGMITLGGPHSSLNKTTDQMTES